jgi:hypothetical protein
VALEFGFGFAKTVVWWSGFVAGPAAFVVFALLLRLRRTHLVLVRLARWVVRQR